MQAKLHPFMEMVIEPAGRLYIVGANGAIGKIATASGRGSTALS
jgi:hypothetical protein